MVTLNSFFAETLSEKEDTRELLRQASIRSQANKLTISCKDDETIQAIRLKIEEVCRKAIPLGVEEIILLEGDTPRGEPINPTLALLWAKSSMHLQSTDLQSTRLPIIQTLSELDNDSIAIIRMSDNKGLFITSPAAIADNASPNDWAGEDIAAKFNIREYFDPYIAKLLEHQNLTRYPLICLDGAGNKQQQIIDAHLTTWRGDIVRVVKVHRKEYL